MFGWVDFSEDERMRAAEVLKLAKSPEAVDELGLGVLRDGLANRLFPGTSTLHTHTKYYFLVAYLMMDLEHRYAGHPIEEIRKAYADSEKDMTRKLIAERESKGLPVLGITGSNFMDTDDWVKQTPAMMNWAAIQAYGIMTNPDMRRDGYFKLVSGLERECAPHGSDTDECSAPTSSGLWNVPLKSYEEYERCSGEGRISLELTDEEANQLKDSICFRWPKSLYAALLSSPDDLLRIDAQTDGGNSGKSFVRLANLLEEDDKLLPSLGDRECVEEAANLSALVALLHIRFNYLLAQAAGQDTKKADERWAEATEKSGGLYWERAKRCKPEMFFELPGSGYSVVDSSAPRNRQMKKFLNKAKKHIKNEELHELDDLIKQRELQVKGHARSKIANPAAYTGLKNGAQNWWYGGLEFTYRLRDALTFAKEIAAKDLSQLQEGER